MTNNDTFSTDVSQKTTPMLSRTVGWVQFALVSACLWLFVEPAAAQSAGSAFCDTDMAQTIQNIFTLIQFGGPLNGGVLVLGATVALPFVRRSDRKKEMKSIRNQGLLWGIIVAPLGTEIVAFILNNVVAGGTSCGF